jgi:cation diffusion facilitator CzcD-associated flavoprotein CzcO
MRTWRRMAPQMYLKSPDFGTSIYTPERGYGFVEYCRQRNIESAERCEISRFAEYGEWAQRELVPEVEPSEVCRVSRSSAGFELQLAPGESLRAQRVVVATGLAHFEKLPAALSGFPAELVSHTSRLSSYSEFRGRRVAVVGAGQSALEAAALLHESGAETTLLIRGDGAYFAPPPGPRPLRHRVLYPSSVLGPGRLNFFLQHAPMATHYLPERRRVTLTRRHLGPWGTWWLRDRVEGQLPVEVRSVVQCAQPVAGGVRLHLRQNGRDRSLLVDHVVCGT